MSADRQNRLSSLEEVRELAREWIECYNHTSPLDVLNGIPPALFREILEQQNTLQAPTSTSTSIAKTLAPFCGTSSLLINAIPVLYTTYECSDTARKFAQLLGVRLFENVAFQPYPCIKCNVSRIDGQRIYHLPFDQQYDDTIIGDDEDDFYAMTVTQAENAGFRRAYRWSVNG